MAEVLHAMGDVAAPPDAPRDRVDLEVARLAGRLAALIERLFPADEGRLPTLARFLYSLAGPAAGLRRQGGVAREDPLERLTTHLDLTELEAELLVLAGAAEAHEGIADAYQALHPGGRARPTAALAAELLAPEAHGRHALQTALLAGQAARAGALLLEDDEPFWRRSLIPGEALWPALHGIDAWPAGIRPLDLRPGTHGLGTWLADEPARRAARALERDAACTIAVTADAPETALARAGALVAARRRTPLALRLPDGATPALARLLVLHSVLRGAVPVLLVADDDARERAALAAALQSTAPILLAGRAGGLIASRDRPLLEVPCQPLTARESAALWRCTVPDLASAARELAVRFPLEPAAAAEVALDLAQTRALERRAVTVDDVARSVRARAGSAVGAGLKLVRPRAGWGQLVLPDGRLAQLREAIDRLLLQGTVLDDWRFLADRQGSRGVRLLFAGPPGTGKTLAAEVLASTIGVDLLVVDLARVVSKWIGETEKNLAEVFDAAERARAVLLFDEADALFGRRTEVSDAHDRYANLETAYLLTRLERFHGLAVLATNLRQNLDPAFLRRLEFVVEFDEPGRAERLALWRCHLPASAPLAHDVDLAALAALYPITGALIRNAALAAAFMAAAERRPITAAHLTRAIRREYDKAGKAFRELPAPPRGDSHG